MWLQIQAGSGLKIFSYVIYYKCHTIFSYFSGVPYFHKHRIRVCHHRYNMNNIFDEHLSLFCHSLLCLHG